LPTAVKHRPLLRALPAAPLPLLLALATCCGAPSPAVAPPPEALPEAPPCTPAIRVHQIFRIFTDGREVGREVRSTSTLDGPLGREILSLSHLSRRYAAGAHDFDRHTVRADLTLAGEGTLLRASYVSMDHLTSSVAQVGFNGAGWERLVEDRVSVTDPPATSPVPVNLTGREIVGLRLYDHMREIAMGTADPSVPVSYYDPSLDGPVEFSFLPPEPGAVDSDGVETPGVWVSALLESALRMKIFYAADGSPLEERYPALHQVRRLHRGAVDLAPESSDPPFNLFSRAYLGVPASASHATFRLATSSRDGDDALSFLGEAENQTLRRTGPTSLGLKVVAGAPDGTAPPTPEDLASTRYIRPADPVIKAALRYLKSAGRAGDLPGLRKQNAAPVIARVELISDPARFWKDPDRVARLVLRFVYAILPDKRHTFTMVDAVETLRAGGGDCTEHSVLFASLMRAAGVPTRLVAGLFLSHGGAWVYHLWAEYWDGARWQPIDPGNGIFRPGALYVAIGKGSSRFSDLRQDVSSFLVTAFSGVSFDLVEAGNNGEELLLARPLLFGGAGQDVAAFEAIVLSSRGDPAAALAAMARSFDPDTSSVGVALFLAELQMDAGLPRAALDSVIALRDKTSAPANTLALDTIALRANLALGDRDGAAAALASITGILDENDPRLTVLKARFLFDTGRQREALSLLDCALQNLSDDPDLLLAYVDLASNAAETPGSPSLEKAFARGEEARSITFHTDAGAYRSLARLSLRAGIADRARELVDHGLVLAPLDRSLLEMSAEISEADRRCVESAARR